MQPNSATFPIYDSNHGRLGTVQVTDEKCGVLRMDGDLFVFLDRFEGGSTKSRPDGGAFVQIGGTIIEITRADIKSIG